MTTQNLNRTLQSIDDLVANYPVLRRVARDLELWDIPADLALARLRRIVESPGLRPQTVEPNLLQAPTFAPEGRKGPTPYPTT